MIKVHLYLQGKKIAENSCRDKIIADMLARELEVDYDEFKAEYQPEDGKLEQDVKWFKEIKSNEKRN